MQDAFKCRVAKTENRMFMGIEHTLNRKLCYNKLSKENCISTASKRIIDKLRYSTAVSVFSNYARTGEMPGFVLFSLFKITMS